MELTWDDAGSRKFEAGVDRGVFYPLTGVGVPWNGLTSVKESVENEGSLVIYVDGQKVINKMQLGTFAANISAVTYPDELYPYDGYQAIPQGQPQALFNLSYRTLVGSDIENLSYGYRLHLIFNCLLIPTAKSNDTITTSVDISDFEWTLTTVPVATPYSRATAHFIIDSTVVEEASLIAIENILYGQDDGPDPRFPSVEEILAIFETNAIFTVVDNGDGTATITGPDDWVYEVAPDQWMISSPSVTFPEDPYVFVRSY